MVKIVMLVLFSVVLLGFASGSVDKVWVERPDGALSCEMEKAQSLEKAAEDLERDKVEILDRRKKHDNKMRIQVCGVPAGTLNAFEIRRSDLPIALNKGFREVVSKKEK